MTDEVQISINGQTVQVAPDTTILQAAESVGIEIPTICYHEACTANGLCRICVVEVEGSRTLVPACIGKVTAGMKVQTDSPRIATSRRTILELLHSSVNLSEAAEIQGYSAVYEANPLRFPESRPRDIPIIDDNPMYVRDYSKCILCWRCVQVCADDAQYTFALNFSGRGYETQIATFFEKPMQATTCVFCGQCVGVCPTGALKPKREYLMEQGLNPDEIQELTRTERRRKHRNT